MSLPFLIEIALLLSIAMAALFVQRGLIVLLMLLPATEVGGWVDPMTIAVKGVFDTHALLGLLILGGIVVSITRLSDLGGALMLKPMLVWIGFWLYGVTYPVFMDYSSFFYALKGSKEFLTVFAYFAVFLFVRTETEIKWGWRIVMGFGIYFSLLELAAQAFGTTLLSHLGYSFRKEISFMWKVYPQFWPVLLIALLHSYFEYALSVGRPFARIWIGSIGLLLTFYRSYLLATVTTAPLFSLFGRQKLSRVMVQGIAMTLVVVVGIAGVWVITVNRGGDMATLTDHFVSSGITEFDTQTGGAIVGREAVSKERRAIVERSPWFGYGFIDKDSQFGHQVRHYVRGDTLGFIDKGDVDVALKFGYAGRALLYATTLWMAWLLVRLARASKSNLLNVRALSIATLLVIFLIVQPVHAPLTYSFALLPLGIALGLLERERYLEARKPVPSQ